MAKDKTRRGEPSRQRPAAVAVAVGGRPRQQGRVARQSARRAVAVPAAARRGGAARAPGYRASLVTRLRWIAAHMRLIGVDMDYYGGGFSELAEHGRELIGAAIIAESWAGELEARK